MYRELGVLLAVKIFEKCVSVDKINKTQKYCNKIYVLQSLIFIPLLQYGSVSEYASVDPNNAIPSCHRNGCTHDSICQLHDEHA